MRAETARRSAVSAALIQIRRACTHARRAAPVLGAPAPALARVREPTAASATLVEQWRAERPHQNQKERPKRPGSGIPARKVIRVLVWVRRVSQVGFLALFLYFLFQTAFRGTFTATAGEPVRLPLPVEGFLLADPFVGAMTLLCTHTVYRGLALVGRGARADARLRARVLRLDLPVRHAAPLLRLDLPESLRARQQARRVEQDAPVAGRQVLPPVGVPRARRSWAAPSAACSIRSASRCAPSGSGVIPALQYFGVRSATVIASSNVRALQNATDGAQDFLARTVWTAKQCYFHQTWLIVFFLVGDPLHEPLHPALLVPGAVPAGRVPRRVRALRPVRDGEGSRQVHRLQPVPRQLPGRR